MNKLSLSSATFYLFARCLLRLQTGALNIVTNFFRIISVYVHRHKWIFNVNVHSMIFWHELIMDKQKNKCSSVIE